MADVLFWNSVMSNAAIVMTATVTIARRPVIPPGVIPISVLNGFSSTLNDMVSLVAPK